MLVNGANNPKCRMPKRGECGIVWSIARDGRPFCVYKSGSVTPEKCAACERRPPSLRRADAE